MRQRAFLARCPRAPPAEREMAAKSMLIRRDETMAPPRAAAENDGGQTDLPRYSPAAAASACTTAILGRRSGGKPCRSFR